MKTRKNRGSLGVILTGGLTEEVTPWAGAMLLVELYRKAICNSPLAVLTCSMVVFSSWRKPFFLGSKALFVSLGGISAFTGNLRHYQA